MGQQLRQIMIDVQGKNPVSNEQQMVMVDEIDRLRAGVVVSTRVLVQGKWHYPEWVMRLIDDLPRSV